MLDEGWYLMSTRDLEIELARLRDRAAEKRTSNALSLTMEEALAFRDAGNIPDEFDRSLRLVLFASGDDPEAFARRRSAFEPDFHEPPSWRRPGSKPVNVVPLRGESSKKELDHWWDDPTIAALEQEWQENQTMAGVKIPGEYRSFVHKTILALRAADQPVTAASIAGSISRWVPPDDAERIRQALLEANPFPLTEDP